MTASRSTDPDVPKAAPTLLLRFLGAAFVVVLAVVVAATTHTYIAVAVAALLLCLVLGVVLAEVARELRSEQ